MRVVPNQARGVVLRIVKRRYSVRLVDVIKQFGLGLRRQDLDLRRIDMETLEFTNASIRSWPSRQRCRTPPRDQCGQAEPRMIEQKF